MMIKQIKVFNLYLIMKPYVWLSKIIFNPAKSNRNPIIEEQQMTIAFKPKLYRRIVSERGYENLPSFYQIADTSGKVFNFAVLNKHPQPILPNEKVS